MYLSMFLTFILLLYINKSQIPNDEIQLYPNNCNDLSDGIHKLKLLPDETFPAVKVRCSNGYIMLDYKLDPNIKSYFTSWDHWFLHTAGPTNSDHMSNWENWFIPSKYHSDKNSNKWLVSNDCKSCDINSGYNLFLGTKTTFTMGGNIFGCFNTVKAVPRCDIDYNTFTCYLCYGTHSEDNFSDRIALTEDNMKMIYYSSEYNYDSLDLRSTGICPMVINPPNLDMTDSHDRCLDDYTYKPSLGTNSSQCQCWKPNDSNTQFYINNYDKSTIIDKNILYSSALSTMNKNSNNKNNKNEHRKIYHLTKDDFKYGTYRITNPGTYIIKEDIEFNFNSPNDLNDMNDIFNSWKPLESQSDDYPGAGGYKDTYFLGFFAGISIESNDVILDLKGHTIGMSKLFYYQQRWFTIIELSKQYFLPGQGFANFGSDPFFSKNIVIKNGILALTSHHGIHGNFNQDILIDNIKVRHFETHGIQFNGFKRVTIQNVEVGPSSTMAKFNGEYAHMRYALDRYKLVGEQVIGTNKEYIQFKDRKDPIRLIDIANEIETKMNYAWNYVVNGISYTSDDSEFDDFEDALKLFVNEEGLPYASAQYGIFLNTFGASTFTYNLYVLDYSEDAVLNNVKVYGMRHKMREYVRLFNGNTFFVYFNPFAAIIDAEVMIDGIENDDFDIELLRQGSYKYRGNILTDANILLNWLSDDWDILGQTAALRGQIGKWVITGNTPDTDATSGTHVFGIGCNSDVMTHSGKGISGIRIDGVDNVEMSNIEVYDLYDTTALGKTKCDNYTKLNLGDAIGGHLKQTPPMQIGFSGNNNQGITLNVAKNVKLDNINIHDLTSLHGDVFGISVWPNSDVTINGDITINKLYAGINLDKGSLDYNSRPNSASEACSIRLYNEWNIIKYGYSESTTLSSTIKSGDSLITVDNIKSSCIDGHVGCFNYNDLDRETQSNKLLESLDNSINHICTYSSQWTNVGTYDDNSDCSDSIHFNKQQKRSKTRSIIKKTRKRLHKKSSNSHSKSSISIPVILSFITLLMILAVLYVEFTHKKSSDHKYKLLNNRRDDYGTI